LAQPQRLREGPRLAASIGQHDILCCCCDNHPKSRSTWYACVRGNCSPGVSLAEGGKIANERTNGQISRQVPPVWNRMCRCVSRRGCRRCLDRQPPDSPLCDLPRPFLRRKHRGAAPDSRILGFGLAVTKRRRFVARGSTAEISIARIRRHSFVGRRFHG
jgi:hypothetical protein